LHFFVRFTQGTTIDIEIRPVRHRWSFFSF
jgi:hypothetical protein